MRDIADCEWTEYTPTLQYADGDFHDSNSAVLGAREIDRGLRARFARELLGASAPRRIQAIAYVPRGAGVAWVGAGGAFFVGPLGIIAGWRTESSQV
jgi:hypothetical protein